MQDATQAGRQGIFANGVLWLEAVAVFVLSTTVYFINLDHTPLYDELYHVLAARSWLEHGAFAIDGGSYTRSRLFTVLVSGFFFLFGESLPVARLPSVIAGGMLATIVYLWTRWSMGRPVALLACLFLIFSPLTIYLSQYARFYALQSAVFAGAAFAFYCLVRGAGKQIMQRAGLLVLIVALLALAFHLQITTIVGMAGLVFWFLCYMVRRYCMVPRDLRRPWLVVLVFAAVGVVTVILILSGVADRYLRFLLSGPYWARSELNMTNIRFYHYWLLEEYPALWSLFPLAALIALARKPAPAAFCLTLFVVTFIIHSLAGFKAQRYFSYAMPFLFIIWACALAEVLPYLRSLVSRIIDHEALLMRKVPQGIQYYVIASIVTVFFLASTPAFPLAFRMLTRADAAWPEDSAYRGAADWEAAAKTLRGNIGEDDLLLTTSGVMALYYLGRYDMEINASNLNETGSASEFSLDSRTGHPVIASPQSLQMLMACYPQGILVAEERRLLRAPNIVPKATSELIKKSMVEITLPKSSKMLAYRWEGKGTAAKDCRNINLVDR